MVWQGLNIGLLMADLHMAVGSFLAQDDQRRYPPLAVMRTTHALRPRVLVLMQRVSPLLSNTKTKQRKNPQVCSRPRTQLSLSMTRYYQRGVRAVPQFKHSALTPLGELESSS